MAVPELHHIIMRCIYDVTRLNYSGEFSLSWGLMKNPSNIISRHNKYNILISRDFPYGKFYAKKQICQNNWVKSYQILYMKGR